MCGKFQWNWKQLFLIGHKSREAVGMGLFRLFVHLFVCFNLTYVPLSVQRSSVGE